MVIEEARPAHAENFPAEVAQQLGHEHADAGEAAVVIGETGPPGVGFEAHSWD